MLEFIVGLTLGAVIGAGLMLLVDQSWRRHKCPHDRIEVHSTQQFANASFVHAICLDCAGAVKFNLGFVAESKGALMRASTAVIETRGYTLTAGTTFERKMDS